MNCASLSPSNRSNRDALAQVLLTSWRRPEVPFRGSAIMPCASVLRPTVTRSKPYPLPTQNCGQNRSENRPPWWTNRRLYGFLYFPWMRLGFVALKGFLICETWVKEFDFPLRFAGFVSFPHFAKMSLIRVRLMRLGFVSLRRRFKGLMRAIQVSSPLPVTRSSCDG